MIQLLLSTPDYVAALDLISTTQEILVQELAGVHSFRYICAEHAALHVFQLPTHLRRKCLVYMDTASTSGKYIFSLGLNMLKI
jgi:hypothetical protein